MKIFNKHKKFHESKNIPLRGDNTKLLCNGQCKKTQY